MSNTAKVVVGLLLVIALAIGLFLRQPTLPSDITAFLPVDSKSSELVTRISTSGMSRRVVLLVEAEDPNTAAEVAGSLVDKLRAQDELFVSASAGPPGRPDSIHALYFDARHNFVAPTQAELDALNTDAGMQAAAGEFVEALQGRFATMLHRLGPKDPLLAFVGVLKRLARLNERGLAVVNGQYRTAEGDAVIFAELAGSPLSSEVATNVEHAIDATFDEVAAGTDATLTVSGLHRYTVAISSMIKGDIQRVTAVSIVGLLFVFGFVFGRLRTALLPLAAIGAGTGVAFAVTAIVLGSVHLLTIAFGASLIGVCVDYSVHFLNHRGAEHESVWPAIYTGAATTLGGFIALLTASVGALHQIAIFSSVGVATAVVVTRALAGFFVSDEPERRHERALDAVERGVEFLRAQRVLAVVLALPVLGCIAGLSQLSFEQDMTAISHPVPELAEADERVRGRVGQAGSSNFVVVEADNADDAMQQNDALAVELQRAVDDGTLGHFSSLHHIVWSRPVQQMNREFLTENSPALRQRMSAAFDEAGVHGEALEPVKDGFALAETELTLADVRQSDLGPLVDLFDPEGTGQLLLTYLGEITDEAALRQRVESAGAFWFSQRRALDEAWTVLGQEVVRAAAMGLGAILLVAIIAYRRPRAIVIALAPAFVASVSTVGFLSLLGYAIGPIHGLALLLVIAIAADYGVMLEAHHHNPGPLTLSVLMAFMTTMCSFGALSLSQHPILHAFGITIATGVTFSLLLLPALDQLLAGSRRESTGVTV